MRLVRGFLSAFNTRLIRLAAAVFQVNRSIQSILAVLSLLIASPAVATEFHDELERDFPLRSIGHLQITNLRGGVTVKGWSLDKIRVVAKRRVVADSEDEARRLLAALDFRYRALDGEIELSAEYGKQLRIDERVQERKNPRTSMEMQVFAPSQLKLRTWTVDGPISVKNWNADLEIRTDSGAVEMLNVAADQVSVFCLTCGIQGENIRGSVRCIGRSGDVQLTHVAGKNVFVETRTGSQRLKRIKGEQLYISEDGRVEGHELKGQVEFQTQRGDVDFQEVFGFLSGRTLTGDISLRVREWFFLDKALIESKTGNIALFLPANFSGEVDLWSVLKKTTLAFPFQSRPNPAVYGPRPANHLFGLIADGGEQLRVFSQEGNVQVLRNH